MRVVKSILIAGAAIVSVLGVPRLLNTTPTIKVSDPLPTPTVYPPVELASAVFPPIDPIETPTPRPTRTPSPTPTPRPVQRAGSIGTDLPVIYSEWWLLPDDDAAYLIMLAESTRFRTNVIWTWEGQVTFDMKIISSQGIELGSLSYDTYSLEPCSLTPCSGYFQRNNLMKDILPSYNDVYAVKIIPTGGTGKVFFYATVIDNLSGDATLITQFRYAKTKEIWALGGLYYYPPGYIPLS